MGDLPQTTRGRDGAIDLLRGLVMVLMALDHARDFFSSYPTDPTVTLDTTTPGLFFTRWVTHFCAPVFIFLAGASAFLAGRRRSRPELARFLATRGLWLVLAELTLVRWSWLFELGFHILIFQVIWVIGVSMIVLAGVVLLPLSPVHTRAISLALGVSLILATTRWMASAPPPSARGAGCGRSSTRAASSLQAAMSRGSSSRSCRGWPWRRWATPPARCSRGPTNVAVASCFGWASG